MPTGNCSRPDDTNWTGAEIKSCCRLASLLDVPLVQAAQNVVPVCHSARQNRPLIGAQNRPPCGWYSVEESSYSVLLARGVIRS